MKKTISAEMKKMTKEQYRKILVHKIMLCMVKLFDGFNVEDYSLALTELAEKCHENIKADDEISCALCEFDAEVVLLFYKLCEEQNIFTGLQLTPNEVIDYYNTDEVVDLITYYAWYGN